MPVAVRCVGVSWELLDERLHRFLDDIIMIKRWKVGGKKGSHHGFVFGEKFRPAYGFGVVRNRVQKRDGCVNLLHRN